MKMAIAQISPKSVASDPAYVNPQVKVDQRAALVENSQAVQKSDNTLKSDTVTLSRVALQKAGNDDSVTQEPKKKEVSAGSADVTTGRFSALA